MADKIKEVPDSNKDICVELLRIIGILMVIGTHIKLDGVVDYNTDIYRSFVACAVGDGVAVFWLILGFFVFKSDNYSQKIKKMVKRVLIPLFVYSMFMLFFYDFIVGNSSIIESVKLYPSDIVYIVYYGLLRWQTVIPGCDHLWYLYVYAVVIIIFPALKGIYDYLEKWFFVQDSKNKIKRLIIGVIVVLLILLINDITFNNLLVFSHHTLSGASAAAVFVIVGALFYRNIDNIKGNIKFGILSSVVLILTLLIRTITQHWLYNHAQGLEQPLFWFTGFSFVSVISVLLIVFGFFEKISNFKYLSYIVSFIGKNVFGIYIIHILVNDFLQNRFNFKNVVISKFGYAGVNVLFYQIIYTLIIFIVSLLICSLFRFVIYTVKYAASESKNND